jgi:hypothetical protein
MSAAERIHVGSLRSIRYYTPLGTVADTPNLQRIGDSLAASTATNGGGELRIRAGTALLAPQAGGEALDIAGWSALIINCHPNTRLLSSCSGSGGFTGFALKAFATLVAYGGGSVLTAPSVVGSNVINVSVAPAVGDTIFIRGNVGVATDAFLASRYVVRVVAGLVVTVDRPVRFAWIAGATVQKVTKALANFALEGNGARLDGTGNRLWEAIAAYRTWLRNVRFGPNDAGAISTDVSSFDIGGVQTGYEGCDVDGVTIASGGLMVESNERHQSIGCNPKRCGDNFRLWDSVDVELTACNPCEGTNSNILIDSNAMAHGGFDTRIRGGTSCKSGNAGVACVAATDTTIEGHASTDAPIGFELSGTTVGAVRTKMIGCTTARNASFAIRSAVASGTRLIGHEDHGGTVASPTAEVLHVDAGDVDADGLATSGPVVTAVIRVQGGSLRVRGARVASTGQAITVRHQAGTLIVDSGEFTAPTIGVQAEGGTTRLGGMSFLGGPGFGVYNLSGTILFTGGNDLSLAATPVRNDNGQASISHDVEERFTATGAINSGFLGLTGLNALEAATRIRIERKTDFRDVQIDVSVPSGATLCTYTVRKNGVDTALTITPGAAATTASLDAAGPNAVNVVFNPGDFLSIQVTAPNGNLVSDLRVTVVGVGT